MKTKQDCESGILDALNNIGLFFDMDTLRSKSIGELMPDSITFISFVIELEQILDIEVPDDFLVVDKISTLDSFSELLESICLSTGEENQINYE